MIEEPKVSTWEGKARRLTYGRTCSSSCSCSNSIFERSCFIGAEMRERRSFVSWNGAGAKRRDRGRALGSENAGKDEDDFFEVGGGRSFDSENAAGMGRGQGGGRREGVR